MNGAPPITDADTDIRGVLVISGPRGAVHSRNSVGCSTTPGVLFTALRYTSPEGLAQASPFGIKCAGFREMAAYVRPSTAAGFSGISVAVRMPTESYRRVPHLRVHVTFSCLKNNNII